MANDFSARYTNANIAQDASPYDRRLFLQLRDKLAKLLSSDELATAMITTILCAQGRGDSVARVFNDATKDRSGAEVQRLFLAVREAITLVVPFAGLPNCMPACFGLVGELRARNITEIPGPRRENFRSIDYTAIGQETVSTIYRGVGNSEVREMTQQYFPDMSYYGRTTIFGYLLGSSPIFELKDAEILIAAAITALNANRQARSHVKCSLQVGNSVKCVTAMVQTVKEIASWNKKPLTGEIDVDQLAEELRQNSSELRG